MAVKLKGIPFDANEIILPDGTLSYDNILYSADFAKWFSIYFSNGILVNVGKPLSDELKVSKYVDDTHIIINTGNMEVNGRTAFVTDVVTMEITPTEPDLLRMDRVVIEMNLEDDYNTFQLKVVSGAPATDPAPPELTRTDEVYQMCLATLTVGTLGITMIEDNRKDALVCGVSKIHIGGGTATGDPASNIPYDNTASHLSGESVQEAIDELAGTDEQKILSKDSWTADSTGEVYTQTIAMPGYTSTMRAPFIDIVPSSEADQTYFGHIWKVETVTDGLKFYANKMLSTDITVKVR